MDIENGLVETTPPPKASLSTEPTDTVNVRTYQDQETPVRSVMSYRVRRVESPFEFYMEYANYPYSYEALFSRMQNFYENSKNQENYQLGKRPAVGGCYACKDTDGNWHRVRVHHVDYTAKRVIVYYLDLAKKQNTSEGFLRELRAQFARQPAQVFCCYLYDVVPLASNADASSSSSTTNLTWSRAACEFFKELVTNKTFTGYVFKQSASHVTEGLPDLISTYGMVLQEELANFKVVKWDACPVNAQMVDAGFAKPIGILASCKHTCEIIGSIPTFKLDDDEWNPTQEQILLLNATRVTLGPDRVLLKRESGSAEPVDEEEDIEEDLEEPFSVAYSNASRFLPRELKASLVYVHCMYTSRPSVLWCQLKGKQDVLELMEKEIENLVEKRQALTEAVAGTFVAVYIQEGNRLKGASFLARGIIREVLSHAPKTYNVLLVDYGSDLSLRYDKVFALPEMFVDIPSFVIRMHLDVEGVHPDRSTFTWSSTAVRDFGQHLEKWEQENHSYFVHRPYHAKILKLEQFDQPLVYNFFKREWKLSAYSARGSYKTIDELKEHPMLRNLYVSFGVDLKFEVVDPCSIYWSFESVSKMLVNKEHATKTETKNHNRLHVEIVNRLSKAGVEYIT